METTNIPEPTSPIPMDWRSQLKRKIDSDKRSKSQLARDAKLSRASIEFYCNGGRSEPRISSLFGLIAALYGEDMADWFTYYSAMITKEILEKRGQ